MLPCDIAVIGAGPYGLAIAAHLRAQHFETLVFGRVMSFWKGSMPKGMLLRSPWTGSHIGDPGGTLTLNHFASAVGASPNEPIPLEFFIRYGEWFQKIAVPDVDPRFVSRVDSVPNGFSLLLEDGETVRARCVVVATGLLGHEHRPPQFDGLPATLVTHSSEHMSFDAFAGKRVVVIGAGQSALESAVLLHENGAEVDLVARASTIHWIGRHPNRQSRSDKIQSIAIRLSAPAQIGPFPLNWLVEQPDIMRCLPSEVKRLVSARALRPSAASWLIPRMTRLRMRNARVVLSAVQSGRRIMLKLDDRSELSADHVLLATGYRPDVTRYSFLPPELVSRMASTDRYPVLSRGLESSVPGLYFAGAAAVSSLGPFMRFVAGSGFAGRRLARHVGQRIREGRSRARLFVSPTQVSEANLPAGGGEVTPLAGVRSVLKEFNDRV